VKLSLHGLRHRLPPGPGRFPYFDPAFGLRIRRDMLGELMRITEAYGPVFTLRMPGLQIVFLVSPEANQRILVTHVDDFTWHDGFFGDLIPFIGRGLLTTDDEDHDRARRLLMPGFTMGRVRTYTDDIVRIVGDAADRLMTGATLELHGWTRALALRVATDVILGMHSTAALGRRLAEHFEAGLSFYGGAFWTTLVLRGPGTPFRRMLRHVAEIDAVLEPEIARRRDGAARDGSVLDTLVHASEGADRLTQQEIRDHALTLLFAGHDTTAATVSWLFALVGRHPEIYRRLQQEIDNRLGTRPPTADDLVSGLPYLDRVLKETLRLYPPAWFGPRRCRNTFEIHGQVIPAGTHVAYCSWLTHRLPQLWSHPDGFDPDRFSAERVRGIVPGAYVPFGRGPRLCLGKRFGELEAKAITVALLRRFDVQLDPAQDFSARTIPTISPRHGVRIRLGVR
jgi:cytochrome P450